MELFYIGSIVLISKNSIILYRILYSVMPKDGIKDLKLYSTKGQYYFIYRIMTQRNNAVLFEKDSII